MISRLFRLFRRRTVEYDGLQKIVIGLGNPGRRYAATRHNVGFQIVDRIAAEADLDLLPGAGDFFAVRLTREGPRTLLIKPTTFMNNSGVAGEQVLSLSGLSPDECLVIVDDLDLPLGVIRFRGRGGSGGHRGLDSLIKYWGTDRFSRLRVGIGRPDRPTADYVLSPFPEEDLDRISGMINVAAEAVGTWLDEGLQKAMSRFN